MGVARRFLRHHHFLLGVAAAYLLLRVVTAWLMTVAAHHQTPGYLPTSTHPYFGLACGWDGSWYRSIVEHGYPSELPRFVVTGEVKQNEWAFYPAYPFLVRGVMTVLGTSFHETAPTVSLILGLAAALVMARLMDEQIGRGGAWATVLMWSAFPASPALQMAYTESLAMLLLCSFLLAMRREHWLTASALALVTGVSRPIALPLGLVGLVAVIVRWRARKDRPLRTTEAVSMAAALLSCAVSGLMWPTIAGWVTGERDAYTKTMSTWRNGAEVVPFDKWVPNMTLKFGELAGPLLIIATVLTLLALVLGPWARGLGPVLRTWCLGYSLYLGAVLDPWSSTFRYMLPLFPLAAVLVGAAWRTRSSEGSAPRRVVENGQPGGSLVLAGLARLRGAGLAVVSRPDAVVLAKAGFFVVWFLVLQAMWIWELLIFIPPADDPP